jgi:putative DNA primase/helicase
MQKRTYQEQVASATPSEPVAQDKSETEQPLPRATLDPKASLKAHLQTMDFPLQIVAILPDKGKLRVFRATNAEELKAVLPKAFYLNKQRWNLYYEANIGGKLNDKGEPARNSEADITHIRCIVGDVDAKDGVTMEQCEEKVDELPLKPSLVVATGGGLQPVYRLNGIVEATEENRAKARAVGEGMAAQLGGDRTFSVEHLFRLPGTMNWPDEKKRARGREKAEATIWEEIGPTYSLDELFGAFGQHAGAGEPAPQESINGGVPAALAHFDPAENSGLASGAVGPWDALPPEDKDKYLAGMLQVPDVIAIAHGGRGEWKDIIAAIARSGAPNAYELGREWSKLDKKQFNEEKFHSTYQSYLKPSGRDKEIGIGSLIKKAEAGGWISPWRRGLPATATSAAQVNGSNGSAPVAHVRPQLIYYGSEMARVVTAATQMLSRANAKIYQRSGKLVQPSVIEGIDAHENKVERLMLREINGISMLCTLSEKIEWVRPDSKGKLYPCDPPRKIADAILSTKSGEFKPLRGICSGPTIRRDGSIIDKPGYDERTGLMVSSNVTLPPIPDRLTKGDALWALMTLKKLLAEFPFVFDANVGESATHNPSLSVALSGIITPIVRHMLLNAPAHGARAPAAGTGKSYLWDIMAAILLGTTCPVIPHSSDPQELDKQLVAELLAGTQITNIDNVNGELGSNVLCQMLSQDSIKPRILGKSESPQIQNHSCVFLSGNNVAPRADLTRRILISDLDRGMERPETYQFKSRPVQTVLADRGKYVAAALTICRAYIQAGKPNQGLTPLNGFEDWSDLVRSPLVWLGEVDPVETLKAARKNDPEVKMLAQFLNAAQKHIRGQSNAKTATEIIAIGQNGSLVGSGAPIAHDPDLQAAIEEFCGGSHRVNNVSLGKKLGGYVKRVCGGLKLKAVERQGYATKWYID